jgi:hypothetical protein
MRRGRLPVARVGVPVGLALLVLGAAWLKTGTVLACSGPPYDVNRADVIAEGWIDRVEISPEPVGQGPFHAVQLTMRVTRSLKGDAPTPLVFTDTSSYFPDPGGGPTGFWAGSSGACGVLDDDPTGQYALIVFERHDGALNTALFMGAVFRDGPDDPKIDRFRRYLEGQLTPGDEPRVVPARAPWGAWLTLANWPYLLAAVLMATVLVVVGGLWARERWRNA